MPGPCHMASAAVLDATSGVLKEVVVYTVLESALPSLAAASAAMDAFLATRAGFLRRTVHADVKAPHRFMDIVEWRSLEEAEQAAHAAETEQSVKAFMKAIASVDLMSHFMSHFAVRT
jgi:hypothetical protein